MGKIKTAKATRVWTFVFPSPIPIYKSIIKLNQHFRHWLEALIIVRIPEMTSFGSGWNRISITQSSDCRERHSQVCHSGKQANYLLPGRSCCCESHSHIQALTWSPHFFVSLPLSLCLAHTDTHTHTYALHHPNIQCNDVILWCLLFLLKEHEIIMVWPHRSQCT